MVLPRLVSVFVLSPVDQLCLSDFLSFPSILSFGHIKKAASGSRPRREELTLRTRSTGREQGREKQVANTLNNFILCFISATQGLFYCKYARTPRSELFVQLLLSFWLVFAYRKSLGRSVSWELRSGVSGMGGGGGEAPLSQNAPRGGWER